MRMLRTTGFLKEDSCFKKTFFYNSGDVFLRDYVQFHVSSTQLFELLPNCHCLVNNKVNSIYPNRVTFDTV